MLIGIVGKPSCGKSTFFKAMTLAEVDIASYPFTTIKPNRGVGHIRIECAEKAFNVKCNPRAGYCAEGSRFVPVELLDVAGLVPGAHEGKGMGNQFLDDLRQADALIHVVDASGSTNEKGESVAPGSYNPQNDVKFLEHELDMWYLQILKKPWEKFARQTQMEKQKVARAIAKQFSGLNATEPMVKDIIARLKLNEEDATKWTEDQVWNFAVELRKRTKPIIIAANKTDLVPEDKFLELKSAFPGLMIPASAESELALKEAARAGLIEYMAGSSDFTIKDESRLNERQKAALTFIKENVLKKYGTTGVQEVLNRAVLELLNYIAIFPGGMNKLEDQYGRVLPDCFLLPHNSTALDFAYKLHTDLGEGFIRAIDVKKRQTVGKEHILNMGDVIEIVSSK